MPPATSTTLIPTRCGSRRQPDEFDLAPSDRVEFDLWYDVPLGTTAREVRLFGSPPSTGGQLVSLPAGAPTPTP